MAIARDMAIADRRGIGVHREGVWAIAVIKAVTAESLRVM
jgi:hypothetical protein